MGVRRGGAGVVEGEPCGCGSSASLVPEGYSVLESKKTDEDGTSIADRFRRHWFPSILLLCSAVAVAAWGIEYQVLVSPRDFKIQSLESELAAKKSQAESSAPTSQIALKPTYLSVGQSVTTEDGICLIHAEGIVYYLAGRYVAPSLNEPEQAGLRVKLSVTVGADKTQFDPKPSGERLVFAAQDAVYYIDIIEIQSTQTSVEVTRQLIPRPTQK